MKKYGHGKLRNQIGFFRRMSNNFSQSQYFSEWVWIRFLWDAVRKLILRSLWIWSIAVSKSPEWFNYNDKNVSKCKFIDPMIDVKILWIIQIEQSSVTVSGHHYESQFPLWIPSKNLLHTGFAGTWSQCRISITLKNTENYCFRSCTKAFFKEYVWNQN